MMTDWRLDWIYFLMVMVTSSLEQTEQMKRLLLDRLEEHQAAMSLQELETKLNQDKSLSSRHIKEAAWELVEEGKVQFNSTWNLEIC